ncbi:phosphopantetheine-binding protein [Desulfopila inferna]|uniref:phosphopantetheine-binding protein n=1 Tax=Desulfopila inferna TaxID=468528 RepID=UPI0019624A2E|nr:phosphopantetheine-binding protein [Desulfopila inferna]MBM9604273.1 acyl carrier protein [Desulfopila inferna]
MENLKKKLKEILVEDLKIPESSLAKFGDDEPLFGEGLGLDSLDAVELAVLIQKNFNVQIIDMDEGRKAFETLNKLAKFIVKKQES